MPTRIWAYVCPRDDGNAPNLSNGLLTLAACKPKIRLGAVPGDIVFGFRRLTGSLLDPAPLFIFRVEQRKQWSQYVQYCEQSATTSEPRRLLLCRLALYEVGSRPYRVMPDVAELRSAANPVGDCHLKGHGELRNVDDTFHNTPDEMARDWDNGVLLSRNFVYWSRGQCSPNIPITPTADWLPGLLQEWSANFQDPAGNNGYIGHRNVQAPIFPQSYVRMLEWGGEHLVHHVY